MRLHYNPLYETGLRFAADFGSVMPFDRVAEVAIRRQVCAGTRPAFAAIRTGYGHSAAREAASGRGAAGGRGVNTRRSEPDQQDDVEGAVVARDNGASNGDSGDE